ncbi:hypothetical protein A2714_05680 [Candidatus Woesebacteria bacterium RIFCSPHIGHO2_01_FULL_38_9]|uniref:Uncharacterized protein n=2 Tax=Candidatus Woeseibacteriota TaxID=1752722 RepID=A0A1F7Y1G2_9BACT|nr:MAG: hypothetical protein A2714_05680 [Candidatus Woesebacteria bacterium RIFCSPHIGHO2_01_FULL_38_9]OGM58381.1 MAG: hypothetical protein A3A75_05060 [Candidatus Woesebacteria bacterium RIFCSPLOWO2_01_FULL_39_10]
MIVPILFVAIFPESARAYIDPGSGSYILQIVIAGLLGASFTVKLYWKKIRSLFSNKKKKVNENPNEKSETS